MANLLQSSQTQATTAPQYYTDYLSNLASAGNNAATNAQYIGAQPLQEQAFGEAGTGTAAYQPTLESAGTSLTNAGAAASPLSAANPYLTMATSSPAEAAQQYMNPYITSVVNALGEAGQRNIRQNLAPAAVAGAVGGGQFGSKRGAEVLGQTLSNANRDILNTQNQALNTGYNTALQTAEQQNALEGQLGSTAATAENAGVQNLINLGQQQGNLATTNQNLELARLNALATLGGQQQTIAQNKELFPLQNLTTLSGLLRGYTTPTTTTTTANMSPLSGLAAVGSGILGVANSPALSSALSSAVGTAGTALNNLFKSTPSTSDIPVTTDLGTYDPTASNEAGTYVPDYTNYDPTASNEAGTYIP
jgi:hypothetical protein